MNGAWKYIAIVSVSVLGGLLTGQFIPNRNLVTREDIAPIQVQITNQTQTIEDLRDQVNELKGELKARKLLAP